MKKPKMIFKNFKELEDCMLEWKEILMLHDWTIEVRLVDELVDEDGNDCWGLTHSELIGRNALISIRQYNSSDANKLTKYCAEQTLVHELLHLVYPLYEKSSFESFYMSTMEHQKLDKMSQSLIMAKYNLKFNWFANKKD